MRRGGMFGKNPILNAGGLGFLHNSLQTIADFLRFALQTVFRSITFDNRHAQKRQTERFGQFDSGRHTFSDRLLPSVQT